MTIRSKRSDMLPPNSWRIRLPAGTRLERPVEALLELLAIAHAEERVDHLAVAEDEEARNAHDGIAPGKLGTAIDVDLDDDDAIAIVLGQLLDDRLHGLARAAPIGLEVDEDDGVALEQLVELALGAGLDDRALAIVGAADQKES